MLQVLLFQFEALGIRVHHEVLACPREDHDFVFRICADGVERNELISYGAPEIYGRTEGQNLRVKDFRFQRPAATRRVKSEAIYFWDTMSEGTVIKARLAVFPRTPLIDIAVANTFQGPVRAARYVVGAGVRDLRVPGFINLPEAAAVSSVAGSFRMVPGLV
jgi:hypothetical protein